MLSFAYPYLFLAFVLPWLLYRFLDPIEVKKSALRVSFFNRLLEVSGINAETQNTPRSSRLSDRIVLLLALVLILTALSRPQFIGEPVVTQTPLRDLVVAVDLSGSMETKDFTSKEGKQVDRLSAVKEVLEDFLANREGERIGLIFFGSAAFVQAPFTRDLNAIERLLHEAQVGMAGPQTMMGDAIGLSLKLFNESNVTERMLIVLSDGDDTGSRVPPKKAAELAASDGVSIYTIAIGDPANANEHPLNTELLEEIASSSGGEFFYALERDELEEITQKIDTLAPKMLKEQSYRPISELYHYPLALVLAVLMLFSFYRLARGVS